MAERDDSLVRELLGAVARAIDPEKLREELAGHAELGGRPKGPGEGGDDVGRQGGIAAKVLERFAMADILDDSILGARPGQTSFPLRLFFGSLSEKADEELAYALGSGINFYFRVPMDEETRIRVALEVSRLYYRFAAEGEMEAKLVRELSPLLAKLLGTQLDRVRLEAVDHIPVFDSNIHERSDDSDKTRAAISTPLTFLCRVVGNDRVRFKALVRT